MQPEPESLRWRLVRLATVLAAFVTCLVALPARAGAETLWVTTLEAVLGLDPVTLETKREIRLPRSLLGALYLMPAPGGRTAYLLSGAREVVSELDLAQGQIRKSWSLSEPDGAESDSRTARARFFGIALDPSGRRILGNIVTSRRSGADGYQDVLALDRPYLAWLDAGTGKRLATISDPPWAVSMIAPMQDPAHPNRFLVIGPDLDIIDLDLLPRGKTPVRASFASVTVKHIPVREVHVSGQGPLVILVEWFHPDPSGGLGSMPYYTTDPIVRRDQFGIVTIDVSTGRVDEIELGPPQGPQYAFSTVVSPDRKRAFTVFNQLHAVDLEQRRLVKVKNLPYTYYACNMSPDGKRLYILSGGARLALVDPGTLEFVKEVTLPSEAWDALTLPDQGPAAE